MPPRDRRVMQLRCRPVRQASCWCRKRLTALAPKSSYLFTFAATAQASALSRLVPALRPFQDLHYRS